MTTALELREHQTAVGVPLSLEQCDALRNGVRDLVVSPSIGQPGCFDVRPGSTVGVIDLDGLSVSIRPKVPIDRLLFLLSYAADPRGWKTDEACYGQAESVVEALAVLFTRQVRRITGRGLLHGYQPLDDALPTIRGRVRFGDQISRRLGDRLPIEVTYDDFTVDIEINRVLRAAAHRLRRMRLRSEVARRGLRALDAHLGDVALVPYDRRRLPTFTWSRLNLHYRPAVELALLILRGASIEAIPGVRRANGLLIDMNIAFEDFVVVALREDLGLSPSQMVQQGSGLGLTLDRGRAIRLRPDLSWWEEGVCRFVGDVKYKRLSGSAIMHGDLYQLHAYLTATDLPAGLLIYAAGEANEADHQVVDGRRRMLVRTLDVDGQPDEVLARVHRLASVVRHLTTLTGDVPSEPVPAGNR